MELRKWLVDVLSLPQIIDLVYCLQPFLSGTMHFTWCIKLQTIRKCGNIIDSEEVSYML